MGIAAAIDEAAREVGSRRMWLLRRAIGTVQLEAPFRWADLSPGDILPYSHFSVPKPTDEGAGPKRWQRDWLYVTSVTENWDSLTVQLRGILLRDRVATLWDPMICQESPDKGQGLPRLDQGNASSLVRTFTRGSKSWCENAAAALSPISAQVVELANDTEEFTTDGQIIQAASTNYVTRPAFVSQLTGWTTVAGTPTAVSDFLLFQTSPLVTAYAIKITGTTPDQISHVTAAIAEQFVRFSMYYAIDPAAASSTGVVWNVQRSSDAKYWRDSDSTWQVAAPDNVFTVTGSAPQRGYSKLMDLGGTGLTCTIYIKSQAVAAEIHRIFHVQLEGQRYATGPMVSDGATFTRSSELLTVKNWHGQWTWPAPPWTVFIRVKPFWSYSDLAASATRTILTAFFDSANFYQLRYSQASQAVVFAYSANGTTTTTTQSLTAAARTVYSLAVRCTGPEGEEGLAAYTLTPYINGVKGTNAVPGIAPIPTVQAFISYGAGSAGGTPFDGWLSRLLIVPLALSDDEIADLSA